MVSTHSWKATISSPQPTSLQSSTQPTMSSFRSPSAFASSTTGASGGTPNATTANATTGMGLFGASSSMSGPGAIMPGSASRPFIGGGSNQRPTATSSAATTPATTTTTAPDFDSLFANSASLLSSMGRGTTTTGSASGIGGAMGGGGGGGVGGGTANYLGTSNNNASNNSASTALGDKSLLELSVASRTTASTGLGGGGGGGIVGTTQGGGGASTYESEASAHRLLAREGYGFDSARLGRTARELERRTNIATTAASTTASGGGFGGGGRMEEEKKDGEIIGSSTLLLEGAGGGGGNESHPLANLQGSTLQQILSSHHEYCVRQSFRQARQWTTKQGQDRVNAKIQSDWEVQRAEILGRGVLGNRFLLGGGSGGGGGGLNNDGGYSLGGGGVASRVPLLEGDSTSTTALTAVGGSTAAGVSTTSSPLGNIVPSPQILPSNTQELIKSHLKAIDNHLTGRNSSSSQSSMSLLSSLQDGLKDIIVASATTNNSGLSAESMNGYSNAYSLISSIVNCTASLGISNSNNSNNNNTMADDGVVASGVMGACNFFAKQFSAHIKETVHAAELAGMHPTSTVNNALTSSTARDVCAFASIVAGRDVVEGRGGVWPRLFYSLRCGDLIAANSILEQFGNSTGGNISEDTAIVDPAVSNIISQLATLQQTQETIFGDSTNGNTRPVQQIQSSLLSPSQAMMQSRGQVSDLYERTKTRLQSSSAEITEPFMHYRIACLAMLGGSESISEAAVLETSGLVRTVEDYMFGSLWHALHLAEDTSSSTLAGSSGRGGGGLQNVSTAVARLSTLVTQWGPSHFEQDEDVNGNMYTSASASVAHATQGGVGVGGSSGMPHKVPVSGGWAYTLPLLATQQYATALAYLAEAGGGLGLLQATHLGVAMDAVGLSISNFNLDRHRSDSSQATLLPMLVASYSASLQGLDAAAALKYLALLSDKDKFIKDQVRRLILETRQFDTLAGKIDNNGTRSNGALDALFSRKEVSTLLVDAANHAIRVGKPADAADLLVLSGRFVALFELMNRELASYLNASPGTDDFAKRQFWFNAASTFHAIHLASGKTYVQVALNSEKNMDFGNTFQLLMNLVVFFDRCRSEQWEGAWDLMDTLSLIPKTESEMTQKVQAFSGLDNCVRQVFHHVVLATMEVLCHQYRNIKQSGGAHQYNTVDQSLDGLRNRARLLVTFARLLNLPNLGDSDTYVKISQLENNMM